eukprot:8269326-Heterocapsa_arctica.AAC.1
MVHNVQVIGLYEYCLDCGRETKAKHNASAKIIFWRRQYCKPVTIMNRYRKRNHDIIFDGEAGKDWWMCKGCRAKGPELNKKRLH